MSDERHTFADDRLLAFVLGLEDDSELEAAIESDPALRERVQALRADTDAIGAGLARVVPAPSDDYADLADARWNELRPFVAQATPAPRRRPAWLRVLAPAVAVALVLVVGVVGVQRLSSGADDEMTAGSADKAAEGYDAREGAGQQGEIEGAATSPALSLGAPDPDAYESIVVARAEAPTDGRQRFAVERVLRGEASAFVTLDVTDRAAAPDTLHVLYLRPLDGKSGGGTGTPAARAGSVTDADATATLLAFRYQHRPAFALQLPEDTDPADVTLP